jgi:hypothetical protein
MPDGCITYGLCAVMAGMAWLVCCNGWMTGLYVYRSISYGCTFNACFVVWLSQCACYKLFAMWVLG